MEIQEFFKTTGAKGGRRQKQTATPEQLAAWGRKGGKTAGRGRPKKAEEPAVASAKVRTAKARAKRAKAKKGA